MGITIHYYAKNDVATSLARDVLDGRMRYADPEQQKKEERKARKNAKLAVPKLGGTLAEARARFFAAVDHVDYRARDFGWEFLGIDVTPKNATNYRDKDGRRLSWCDFGGNVIQYFWLPAEGSEAFELGFNFDTGEFVGGFTKTQYIKENRLKKHIEVCEVLTEVNALLGGILDINDEAHYLPNRRVDLAGQHFGESDAMIRSIGNALREKLGKENIVTGQDLADAA